jgi:hypothetical protein
LLPPDGRGAKPPRSRTLHERHGRAYIEAPIFGVPAQAVGRKLLVLVAPPSDFSVRALDADAPGDPARPRRLDWATR